MGITMTGCLLRRERLRQNLSLEGVAGGVCTAAHLSKIEKGLAQPSPEMVRRLFASLKIDFIQDPALLREPAEALEQYFDAILHNEDTHLLAAYIRENVTLLNNSICHVDYHLFRLDQKEVSQKYGDEVEYLASFYCCMSENQKFFYHYLSAEVQNDYPTRVSHLLEAERIRPGADVFLDPVYELPADETAEEAAQPMPLASNGMIGSYAAWETGYTGAGRRIAIIDTGIDSDHDSFNAEAFRYSLEQTAEKDGKTVEDFALLDAAEIAQLLAMKVFSNGGGASATDYVAAIEDALLLGADVVNASLGSSYAGFTDSGNAYFDQVFDALVGTDTVVTFSAGNSYTWATFTDSETGLLYADDAGQYTAGSPGTYDNALSVASVNDAARTGLAVRFGDALDVVYTETSGYGNDPFVSLDTTGSGTAYDYVPPEGYGVAEDDAGLDVTGKVVLVSRGETSFY